MTQIANALMQSNNFFSCDWQCHIRISHYRQQTLVSLMQRICKHVEVILVAEAVLYISLMGLASDVRNCALLGGCPWGGGGGGRQENITL